MSERLEIRLTGSGGQGVILATIILAEAAVISGKNAAQSQSYGPEARGGMCKAEVIVDDRPIGFTKVLNPTFFMALTQKSVNRYLYDLGPSCTILIDSSLELPEGVDASQVISLPILQTAAERVGNRMTANIVAVGVINKLWGLVSDAQ